MAKVKERYDFAREQGSGVKGENVVPSIFHGWMLFFFFFFSFFSSFVIFSKDFWGKSRRKIRSFLSSSVGIFIDVFFDFI